jgi:hypothetical protein
MITAPTVEHVLNEQGDGDGCASSSSSEFLQFHPRRHATQNAASCTITKKAVYDAIVGTPTAADKKTDPDVGKRGSKTTKNVTQNYEKDNCETSQPSQNNDKDEHSSNGDSDGVRFQTIALYGIIQGESCSFPLAGSRKIHGGGTCYR